MNKIIFSLIIFISVLHNITIAQNTQVPIIVPSGTNIPAQIPPNMLGVQQPPVTDKPPTTDQVNSSTPENISDITKDMDKQEFREKDLEYVDGLPIFGNSVFKNKSSSFAPNTNIPTPENYTVGPGDQLRIEVTGLSLKSWPELTVQPDGSIFLDQIGKVYIGGNLWDEARQIIINKLISHNVAIGRGSDATITLVNIRSMKISIIGEVEMQGDYTVSSLTTLFNALYLAGGIKKNGSFRAIEIRRNNQLYKLVDVYRYLLYGDLSDNIQLRDGDVIIVPLYKIRVGIAGEVKRPAMFEVVSGETLNDVIKFAGGFTEFAYPNVIDAVQLTDREKRIRTIEIKDKDYYYPQNGDRYTINRILDRYENRVSISGAVNRPGMYELDVVPTLNALLKKADGLKEEAFLDRAFIMRQNPKDFSSEMVTIDIRGIINGTSPDVVLQREDVIEIKSIYDITEKSTVKIGGHVQNPTEVPFFPGMTVEDLILKTGGFRDGAEYSKVQISRRVTNSDKMSKEAVLANVFNVEIDPYLRITEKRTELQPYDVVSVFADPGFAKIATVTIEGQVFRPGNYNLLTKNERLSQVIIRAGGTAEGSYLRGATLRRQSRPSTSSEQVLAEQRKINRRQRNMIIDQKVDGVIEKVENDSLDQKIEPQFVNINLEKALKNPGGIDDIILLDGDVISIPSQMQTVRIVGEVNQPTIAVFLPNKNVENYITDNAGGYNELAYRKLVYVSYPNGATRGRSFWGTYPRVEPGCEIVVPYREPKEKKGFDVQTFTAVSSTLASMAALVFAIIRLN